MHHRLYSDVDPGAGCAMDAFFSAISTPKNLCRELCLTKHVGTLWVGIIPSSSAKSTCYLNLFFFLQGWTVELLLQNTFKGGVMDPKLFVAILALLVQVPLPSQQQANDFAPWY